MFQTTNQICTVMVGVWHCFSHSTIRIGHRLPPVQRPHEVFVSEGKPVVEGRSLCSSDLAGNPSILFTLFHGKMFLFQVAKNSNFGNVRSADFQGLFLTNYVSQPLNPEANFFEVERVTTRIWQVLSENILTTEVTVVLSKRAHQWNVPK